MPANIYTLEDGTRVPSVTTIIGGNCGWNKRQLMIWANKEGLAGRSMWEKSREEADVGTVAHAYVTDDASGKEPIDPEAVKTDRFRDGIEEQFPQLNEEQIRKVHYCVRAWMIWKEMHDFEFLADEQYLVSEKHRFGGQLDLAVLMGQRMILDIKTGKGVYDDMLLQISAYGQLWNEAHPDEPIKGYALLLLGKFDAAFHYHVWPSLDREWEGFKALLQLHQIKKQMKERGIG